MMIVVLTAATVIHVAGQTAGKQSAKIKADEQEIISLSQKFAAETVFNDLPVAKQAPRAALEPTTIAADGQADPLKMENIRVQIKGSGATLTSRLVFSGRRSNGEAYARSESWTVTLVKQEDKWRVVQAQIGRDR
jgi:ketosteroid isomerase-like protein